MDHEIFLVLRKTKVFRHFHPWERAIFSLAPTEADSKLHLDKEVYVGFLVSGSRCLTAVNGKLFY